MKNNILKIGTEVMWRGCWGNDAAKKVTIESMQLCEKEGQKYGIEVTEIWTNLKDRCVFDFKENSHWAYGYQIDLIDEKIEAL